MKLVSVDTGGTFTDVLYFDQTTQTFLASKHPSTPENPAKAFLSCLDEIIDSGIDPATLGRVIHGTTIAANTVLTRSGARTGLITTKGFRDILEIGRSARPFGDMFNQRWEKPKPLVERYLRLGVSERTNARGAMITPLNTHEFVDAVNFLVGHDIKSLSICFLFSYLNPDNERRAKELVLQYFPDLPVSISSEILPQWREYERTNTTVVDAYVKPVVARHLALLEDGLVERGYRGDVLVMKSNGGSTLLSNAANHPVETFLSGPAAAMVAAKNIAQNAGIGNVVAIDVGGTSFDMAILTARGVQLNTEAEIAPTLPVKLAMVDVTTIGAGGGSIAWKDESGGLNVGPRSAGALPGPVCFGFGGREPTVTDANLVLRRIEPSLFAGGRITIKPELAHAALSDLAMTFGFTIETLAQGILDIAASSMAQEIRAAASKTGADLRDFVLFAGGGAGPLFAPQIARELGITRVLVPLLPGMVSAIGLMLSDLRFDSLKSFSVTIENTDIDNVAKVLIEMGREGLERMERERLSAKVECRYFLDARYQGQHSEITIEVDPTSWSKETLTEKFDAEHQRLFGFSMSEQRHEVVNLRCSVEGSWGEPQEILNRLVPISHSSVSTNPAKTTSLYDEVKRKYVDAQLYMRTDLACQQRLIGPAIVMSADSTVYIPSDSDAEVDTSGNILINVGRIA